MAKSSYTSARQLLKEEFALNGKTTQEDLLDDRTCLRYWSEIPMGRVSECLDFLRNVTSVINTKDSHSVTNPKINKEELPGKWRHVQEYALPPRAKSEPDVQDVYQFLKFGWAEAIDWAEARLVDGDNQPLQPERILRVQFVNLDYTKLGAMIDGIETTKYFTNPVIAGEKYDGPVTGTPPVATDQRWRVLSAKPSRIDDGSGVITLTLAKNLIMTPDVLPAPVLLSDDKALLSPFAHDTTSFKNAHVWEYRWIDPDYVQALRNAIVLSAGVIDAKAIKAEDGSCNIQVLTQTNTWNGNLSQVWEHRDQFPTFAANQVVDTYSHIPLASLAGFKTTLRTATTGYKVSSLVDSTAEEGFAKIVRTQDKLFVGAVTANNGVRTAEDILILMTTGVIRTTVWLGVKDADLDAAMTTLLTAPTGYVGLRVGNNYSGTGSCDITRTMLTKGTIADKIQVAIEYPTFEGERITYHYPGLNLTDAKALYITLQTAVVVGYKTDSVSIVESKMALTVIQQLSKVQVTSFTVSAIHAQSFTHSFGLVTRATTAYLNVPFAAIGTVKTAINAISTIIVLDISDDDHGTGSANVTYTWRTKEATPRALGAIRSSKPSQFHQTTQDRLWIDVNLTSVTALSNAVALALAGTAPYAVSAGDTIQSADGQDAGDKTGNISQKITKKPATYTPALYSMQESLNPHGLQSATMLIPVKEYPEIAYADLSTIFTSLQAFLITAPSTVSKGRIQVSLNGNGTFMMRALKEGTPTWANTTATPTYVKVGVQNPGAIGEAKTELATGVPVAGAAAIVAAGVADADYALDSIRMTERGEGEATIDKQQTKKSETAIVIRAIPASGTQRAAEERTWPLVLNANLATVWATALTEGVTATSVLKYRQRRNLAGGMWEVSNLVESTQVFVTSFTAGYRPGVVETSERGQDATVIPVITEVTGKNTSVVGELNQLNKYDYRKEIRDGVYFYTEYTYQSRYGTNFVGQGISATEAQYQAAVVAAALTALTSNRISKTPSDLKDLFNFTIEKTPYQPNDITTYYGTLADTSKTLYDFEKRINTTGYKWRKITITVRDYSTNFSALTACWGVLDGGDADSTRPKFLGLVAGSAAYNCVRISRSYGTWTDYVDSTGVTVES